MRKPHGLEFTVGPKDYWGLEFFVGLKDIRVQKFRDLCPQKEHPILFCL